MPDQVRRRRILGLHHHRLRRVDGRGAVVVAILRDGPGAYSIAVSPDSSKVFVSGGSSSNGTATIAYDASTGAQLYVIQSLGTMIPWHALAVSPDSATVYVATNDDAQSPCGFRFTAYDASNGTPQWTALDPSCDGDGNLAMALSPDGSTLYAAGYANSGFATVAYDASTGAPLWTTMTHQLRFNGDPDPSLAVSPNGARVFVLGYADCTPLLRPAARHHRV